MSSRYWIGEWTACFRQTIQTAVDCGSGANAAPPDYKAVGTIDRPPLPGLMIVAPNPAAGALGLGSELEVSVPVTAGTVAQIKSHLGGAALTSKSGCLQLNVFQFRFDNHQWNNAVCLKRSTGWIADLML